MATYVLEEELAFVEADRISHREDGVPCVRLPSYFRIDGFISHEHHTSSAPETGSNPKAE